MFIIILERIIALTMLLCVFYFIYKWYKRTLIKEEHRNALEEATAHINETIDTAKRLPKINKEQLSKARKAIDRVLEEGKK